MARTKDFDENEVLTKAASLFWHKGYNGTSMQDLVDGLGISRSSIYDTYGNKHTLFIKALQSYQSASAGKVCDMINKSVSTKEAIKQLLELITAELLSDRQHKGCFLVNTEVEVAPHDKEIRDMVCRNDLQIENAFCRAIQKGQDMGEITNKQDARALTHFILNNIKGIRVSAKTVTDKVFFDDIIKLTMSVLD